MISFDDVKSLLEEKNQLQLLAFYDMLGEQERQRLMSQIQDVDFSVLDLIENRES